MMDFVESIVGFAAMATVPGYLVLQPLMALHFTGGWRKAACVPLIGAVPTILWSLYALSQDSNLWPLTFILFAPLGFIYLVVLWIAHRGVTRPAA
jgi:hypothetical protein